MPQRDPRLDGCEVVRVDERVDPGKGLSLDHAAQEGLGRGSDLRRVDPDPPEEVPVRAEPRLVLQRLERVRAPVAGHALLDECRSYIVVGLTRRPVTSNASASRPGNSAARSGPGRNTTCRETASPPKRLRGLVTSQDPV